ncbi:MAG: hypothetical protein Fur0028_16370 [Bacteroidales bacterium]
MSVDKEKFFQWAARNFSGCDGKNANAPVWVCGIEWGATKSSEEKTIAEYAKYKAQIEKNEVEANDYYDWKEQHKHQYSLKFAKLYTVLKGHKISDVNKLIETYSGDEVLKLNLYPIFFKNTSPEYWNKYKLEEIIGFKNKDLYMKWCHINRFAFFKGLVKKNRPKLIICCGITYADEFLNAFVPDDESFRYEVHAETFKDSSESNNSERYCYYAKTKDGTFIFIVPFFGHQKGSLNSDELIQRLGDIIVSKVGIIP